MQTTIQQLCDVYLGTETNKYMNFTSLTSEWDNPKLIFCYDDSLHELITKIHFFKNPFILVTQNSNIISDAYLQILENKHLLRWFAKNIMIDHRKLYLLPDENVVNPTEFNYYKSLIQLTSKCLTHTNSGLRSYSHVDNKRIPLDYKLDAIFNKTNGFYIELGANDGIAQSNTAFFEFFRNWTGVLIEPSKTAFDSCVSNRPRSLCFNYACVADDFKEDVIAGDFNGNLMSSIEGKRCCSSQLVNVPCTTLETILDKVGATHIDLLSLDVEGYELEILKGLNLKKYKPTFILIEIYNKDYIHTMDFMRLHDYTCLLNFSNYNKIDNPFWDGEHNDYLFVYNKSL